MHFKNQYLLNNHKTTITRIFIIDNLCCLFKKLFDMLKQMESICLFGNWKQYQKLFKIKLLFNQ